MAISFDLRRANRALCSTGDAVGSATQTSKIGCVFQRHCCTGRRKRRLWPAFLLARSLVTHPAAHVWRPFAVLERLDEGLAAPNDCRPWFALPEKENRRAADDFSIVAERIEEMSLGRNAA
jgi:hypothetical protein